MSSKHHGKGFPMQATVLCGTSTARTARRLAAGLLTLFVAGVPSAGSAGDAAWPEASQIPASRVTQGVIQVRHVLQTTAPVGHESLPVNNDAPLRVIPSRRAAPPPTIDLSTPPSDAAAPAVPPAPPVALPDNEVAPLRQVPARGAAAQSMIDLSTSAPQEDAPGGGDLRHAEILLTPMNTITQSASAPPPGRADSLFTNRVDLTGPNNGWFETRSTGHVACVNFHPLYFEELSLERYGDSFGFWQPLLSAACFYGRMPILPYMLVAAPPCTYESSCEFPPAGMPAGDVSCRRPIDLKAAAFEAGVVAAAFLLVP